MPLFNCIIGDIGIGQDRNMEFGNNTNATENVETTAATEAISGMNTTIAATTVPSWAAYLVASQYVMHVYTWTLLFAGNYGNIMIIVVMLNPRMRHSSANAYLAGKLFYTLYPSQTGPTTSSRPVGDQLLHVIAIQS